MSYQQQSQPQARRPMYHFGRQPPQTYQPPSQGSRASRYGPQYESVAPKDFTFRAGSDAPHFPPPPPPPPPQSRPRAPPRRAERNERSHSQRHPLPRRPDRHYGPRNGRPYRPNIATSNRALLQAKREPTPEQMQGMNDGSSRFKNVDDLSLSDSDNAGADGDDETNHTSAMSPPEEGEVNEPAHKRLRVGPQNEPPRWSNPDPYTALPPPDESTGKKKDMVQLIRKARTETTTGKATPTKEGDDFISFNFDSVSGFDVADGQGRDGDVQSNGFSHRHNLHQGSELPSKPSSLRFAPIHMPAQQRQPEPPAPGTLSLDTWVPPPPPPPPRRARFYSPTPPPPPPLSPTLMHPSTAPLGASSQIFPVLPDVDTSASSMSGRKRGRSDISDESIDVVPMSQRQHMLNRSIVSEWRPKTQYSSHPWIFRPYDASLQPDVRLHQEICDFYEYLRPQQVENTIREELVQNLQLCLDKSRRGSVVRFFGSFAAGLYLPGSDMDLVVFSYPFLNSGVADPAMCKYSGLRKFGDLLVRQGIAKPGTVAVISKAKVPLVKYIDRKTLLKVDISFDNDTGVIANDTYRDWKVRFPAMPILATLIKQFLLMRNMNEVHTGGLGGFSVTCLVVSFLQHIPEDSLSPLSNLGHMFTSFLNYYGNSFNLDHTGIELRPPRLFNKQNDPRIKHKANGPPKLAIIDPNRPDNDISGGSHQVLQIFGAFSAAVSVLNDRIAKLRGVGSQSYDDGSILGVVFAGDYASFEGQRAHFRALKPAR